MSKAFTKEDDAGEAFVPRPVSVLPPGARNLLTPGGAKKLEDERAALLARRPVLLATTGESGLQGADAKEELARLDQRLGQLEESLRRAEIVPPPSPPHDQVKFGATVTVRDLKGQASVYRIVGPDEADLAQEEVSHVSPIARALLNARVGDKVPFRFPAGATQLEILSVEYR